MSRLNISLILSKNSQFRINKLIYILALLISLSPTQLVIPLQKTSAQNHTDPWGKDADLASESFKSSHDSTSQNHIQKSDFCKNSVPILESLSQNLSKKLIDFHQDVISPADGPRSHHKPSSSQYTLEAIQKHGFFLGVSMGCDRLMRENDDPWIYPTVTDSSGDCFKWDPVR